MAKFVCSLFIFTALGLTSGKLLAGNQICDYFEQCLSEENSRRYQSALIHINQTQWQQAFALLESLYLEANSNQLVVNNYAVVLTELGYKAEAAWILEQYLSQNEKLGTSFKNLMQAYENLALAGTAADSLTISLEVIEESQTVVTPELTPLDIAANELASKDDRNDQYLETVSSRLKDFAADWSTGDVSRYFSYYWPEKSPIENVSFNQWKQQRALRISPERDIRVRVNSVAVYFREEGEVVTDFVQHYQARNYQDSVSKRLIWKMREDQWLIVSESNI